MTEPPTPKSSQAWSFGPVLDLFSRLSSSTEAYELPGLRFQLPRNGPPDTNKPAKRLGDFSALWEQLGVHNITHEELDVGVDDSAPYIPCQDDSSGPSDSLSSAENRLSSVTDDFIVSDGSSDDSHTPDQCETHVAKAEELRNTRVAKYAKLKQRKEELENISSLDKALREQVSLLKNVENLRLLANDANIQSSKIQTSRTRTQNLSSAPQEGKSSRIKLEAGTPSRWKLAGFSNCVPDDLSGRLGPRQKLTQQETRAMIVNKLSRSVIDKNTLLNPPTQLRLSADSEVIHVFVDCSNISIGFQHAVKTDRGIPEHVSWKYKVLDFSYRSLAFIMERNRPTARRILVGSRSNHDVDLKSHFVEAQQCGYEVSILTRLIKDRYYTTKKVRRGRGIGYLAGKSSGSDTPYSSTELRSRGKGSCEQGVDELLHMKFLESLVDFQAEPSTIVLATGDGAEAEYSAGFLRNVERALERGWKVELVAWKEGLSREYSSKIFLRRWRTQFSIIYLDEFLEELFPRAPENPPDGATSAGSTS